MSAPDPVATRAGVTRDTARNQILLDHPDALAVTALRTRSVHAREVLVEAAWPGRSAQEVDAWAAGVCGAAAGSGASPETEAGAVATLPEGADAFHLGQLARVLALQTRDPGDVARGRALLEALAACGRLDDLHPQAALVLLHLRCLDRDVGGCTSRPATGSTRSPLIEHPSVPADVAAAVRADLANPFSAPDRHGRQPAPADVDAWLALLGAALHTPALAPLRLTDVEEVPPFDRLTTDPLPPADTTGRALVTVVVSAHEPGPPLLTAVGSLVAQTWGLLEILVVDDASPPTGPDDPHHWLRQAEALDPRVRVIRKAVNGGTYRARNTALRQARGDYLTTLDSDDWLHPQAVETLVRALEADPAVMATRGLGARVSEDLALVKLGYRHRAVAAPTLLVRLDPVLSRLGFFDPARKSADTEYARRIQAAFGDHAVRTVDECLLLLRSGHTLSASEFSRMWRHGSRHAYKGLYTPWHEEIRAGDAAYLDPHEDRPVPEPRRWTRPRDTDLAPPRRLHLVLAGDWRRYGGPQRSMIEEIRAAREAGLDVGILQLEALRFATTKDLPLCAPVVDLVRRGEVEWVQLDDDVEVDVLMVRYPLVLQHPPTVPSGRVLAPRHLLVVANQAPLEPDGSDQRYVVADVTERARELFGTEPVWVPQGPVIREVLLAQDPTVRLTDWDNPGLIDLAEWHVRPDRAPAAGGAPVVVGRYSRDHPLKHPATHADMLAAYDLGPGYAVRLMGSRATWRRLVAEAGVAETPVPAGWEMLRAGSVDPRDLLRDLDFFVYQDHPGRHEAFGRVLLEAAASGVVVVAHPKHGRVFGDLLDYAVPGEVRAVVESYVRDPERYAARVTRMQELVAERYSHASFVTRLESLPGLAQRWAEDRAHGHDRGHAWHGEAVVTVRRARAGSQVEVGLEQRSGLPLVVHETVLRSAADAQRPDRLVLVHAADLSEASRDRLRAALAVPAEADLAPAVREAVAGSDDVPLALLVRDGAVEVVEGADRAGDGRWAHESGPDVVAVVHLSARPESLPTPGPP